MKRWVKRSVVAFAGIGASGFASYGVWMMAYAADIEVALLSHCEKDYEHKVNSSTGPSDDVIARLRRLGVRVSRKSPDDYGIDLIIWPTGLQSARVQYEERHGPLSGSGYIVFVRRINGVWKVDHVEHSFEV
jgi:hypothetical protein